MPEAPEVQTVLSTLEHQIKGAKILNVKVYYPKLIQNIDATEFESSLKNQRFRDFFRIGKYLGFVMDDLDLIVHLRMEGKFYILKELPSDLKHIHCVMYLDDGRLLCYHDTRKFGRMALHPKVTDVRRLDCFKNVGYDCLDENLDGMTFYKIIHPLKRNIKSALLDQSIMAGVGNIYADEILFSCKLDPRSRCQKISKKDCENIVYHTKRIMRGAMKAGGTTIRSYTSSLGVTGLFQLELKVHSKKDEPCPVCKNKIKKIVVSQRGTYLCSNCQKRK